MADNAESCPVDHKTRDAWLQAARAAEASKQSQIPNQTPATCPVDHSSKAPSSWTQKISSLIWSAPASETPTLPANHPAISSHPGLDNGRVTSSIPRSFSADAQDCPVDHGASANPSNAEVESGRDASGNWVYPSEKMFFDAMKRKGYDAREVDMKTVVPIHNAVNERAWAKIKEWEAPYLTESKYVTSLYSYLYSNPSTISILYEKCTSNKAILQMRRPQTHLLCQQKRTHDPNRPHKHHPRLHCALRPPRLGH